MINVYLLLDYKGLKLVSLSNAYRAVAVLPLGILL